METQPTVDANTILLTTCAPNWSMEIDIVYVILRTLILYAVPLMFMSFAYYQIVRVLWSTESIPGGRREVPVANGNGAAHHENGQCNAQRKSSSLCLFPGIVQNNKKPGHNYSRKHIIHLQRKMMKLIK